MNFYILAMSLHTVFIGLGANVGSPLQNLKKACRYLSKIADTTTEIDRTDGNLLAGEGIRYSSVYSSAPLGPVGQDRYYNMAVQLRTELGLEDLIRFCKGVEVLIGRKNRGYWCSREIDLDILFYNDDIVESEHCTIPHPHFQDRSFVLYPLAELDEFWVDPRSGKLIQHLVSELGPVSEEEIYKMENAVVSAAEEDRNYDEVA